MKWCCACRQFKPFAEFHNSRSRGYSVRCKPCGIEYAKKWYEANKERKRLYDAKRRAEKRHLYRAASKRFREANPGLKNADTQLRGAALSKRLPKWSSRVFISEIYDLAARRSSAWCVQMVVDHVVPLRGERVSGLHVPENLRIVPEDVNLQKSNHFSLEWEGVR